MKFAFIAFVATSTLAFAVAAQAPGGPPPGGGPPPSPEAQAARQAALKICEPDAKTLCSGQTGRELMMCLRQNTAKLSSPCQGAMSKLPPPPAGGPPR